jgi:stress-induced morphogen
VSKLTPVIEPSEVEAKLKEAFPDAELLIEDLTGTKDHYQARVVTEAFEGKSMIQQHQLVYGALKEEMKGAIHALALKTFTPEAWKASQS